MKNNFIQNIRMLLAPEDFNIAKTELKKINREHQEIAILLAKVGFSSEKILANLDAIFEFTCNTKFTAREAIRMITSLESSYKAGSTLREILVSENNKLNTKRKPKTFLEEKILLTISETYPYSLKEIHNVYERCESFDETIEIIEKSMRLSTPLMILLSPSGN